MGVPDLRLGTGQKGLFPVESSFLPKVAYSLTFQLLVKSSIFDICLLNSVTSVTEPGDQGILCP